MKSMAFLRNRIKSCSRLTWFKPQRWHHFNYLTKHTKVLLKSTIIKKYYTVLLCNVCQLVLYKKVANTKLFFCRLMVQLIQVTKPPWILSNPVSECYFYKHYSPVSHKIELRVLFSLFTGIKY